MKKKTLRTAQEEITGIVPVILFSILWYTILIRLMVQAGAGGLLSTGGIVYLLFAAAGLLPIYTVIQKTQKADNRTWTQRKRTYCQCNSKDGNAPVIKGQDAHAHTLFSQC